MSPGSVTHRIAAKIRIKDWNYGTLPLTLIYQKMSIVRTPQGMSRTIITCK